MTTVASAEITIEGPHMVAAITPSYLTSLIYNDCPWTSR